MPPIRDRAAFIDRAVLLCLLGFFLLVSLKALWATPSRPWYTIFLLWGSIVGLAFWLQRRYRDEV